MADLAAALAAHQTAVGGGTLENKAREWKRTQSTATALDLDTTPSLTGCQDSTRSKLWAHLPWLFAKGDFQEQLMLLWLTAQLEIPSTLWLQPSGTMEGTTPNEMRKITLHDFYGVS
jgi:hypothetical protein